MYSRKQDEGDVKEMNILDVPSQKNFVTESAVKITLARR